MSAESRTAERRAADSGAAEGGVAEGGAAEGGAGDGGAGERQVPFFCPYCGEEGLRPAGAQPGSWECLSCARGFQLRFTGLVARGAGVAP